MSEIKSLSIKMIAMDVDGTLTNGMIYIGENGEIMKAFNVKDGYAISDMMSEHGIIPMIITGRKSKIVENRARELGVELVYQGVKDKLELIKKLAEENDVTLKEVAYIGDDINDLDCIKACGYSGCPQDAVDEVRACADYTSTKNGGAGAVSEFIQQVINLGGVGKRC